MALAAAGVFAAISSQLAAQAPRPTAVGFTAAQAERGQAATPNTARRATARTSTMGRSRRRCRGWTSVRSGATNRPRRCSRRRAPRCRRRGPARSATRPTRRCSRTSCARTARAPASGRCPASASALKALALPSWPRGGGGGLAPGATMPPAPTRANPLQKITPVTEAMLDAPREGEWLTWRRTYDAYGFSPLKKINKTQRRRPPPGVELVAARGTERHDADRPRRRDVRARVRRQGPGARRRDRRSALAVLAPAAAGRPAEPQAQPLDLRHAPLRARPPTSTSSRST